MLACIFFVTVGSSSPAWELGIQKLLERSGIRAAPISVTTSNESAISEDLRDSVPKRSRSDFEPLTWTDLVDSVRTSLLPKSEDTAARLPWDPALSSRFKKLVVEQIRSDLQRVDLVPEVRYPLTASERTAIGPLVLETEVFCSTATSCLLTVEGRPDLLMKYQTDSPLDGILIHPLLTDFWFLQAVEHLGISPRPFAVSSPVHLPERAALKTMFQMKPVERRTHSVLGAMVRYSIMERGGLSLHAYMQTRPDKHVGFKESIQIGIKLLNLVRRLHDDGGIVHGDLHTGNFVFRSADAEDFWIIDYGAAYYIADFPENTRVRPDRSWIHGMFTPWEIEGFKPGRRDDVFKVILAVAWIMNGQHLMDHFISIEDDEDESYAIKASGDLFRALPGYDPLSEISLPPRLRQKVLGKLSNVLHIVRNIQSVSERPDYEGIISELESVTSLV